MPDDGDVTVALERYRWSHSMAAELWTVIGHFEVLLRHRIDELLREYYREDERGIPWFLQPGVLSEKGRDSITTVVERLHGEKKLSRDQIIAGLSFGFWKGFFGADASELWKHCLHKAVRYDKANYPTRQKVVSDLESIRKLRNRVAHHDSLANVPLAEEVHRILRLAAAIDPEAEAWISQNSKWRDVASERPDLDNNAVVVAARIAWDIYQATAAEDSLGAAFYVCQPGRFFRDVEYLGFYEDRKIHQPFPQIIAIRDDVAWNQENADRLKQSEDRTDGKIGRFIEWALGPGAHFPWTTRNVDVSGGGSESVTAPSENARFKVFVLTTPRDRRTRNLNAPLTNSRTGKGSAFTQRQRYVSLEKIQVADSIEDVLDADLPE